jgi:hypothetical protein
MFRAEISNERFMCKGTESQDFYYLKRKGQCPEILACVMGFFPHIYFIYKIDLTVFEQHNNYKLSNAHILDVKKATCLGYTLEQACTRVPHLETCDSSKFSHVSRYAPIIYIISPSS